MHSDTNKPKSLVGLDNGTDQVPGDHLSARQTTSAKDSLTVVVLSTADFDAPVWTNKQHLATGLSSNADVVYIESMGLRRPTLRMVDIFRLVSRMKGIVSNRLIGRAPKRTYEVPDRMTIITPAVLPFHGITAVAWVNRQLIKQQVSKKLQSRGDYVLWTFSPITYGVESQAKYSVYHSVDLLHQLPGVPKKALVDAETELLKKVDRVVVSSRGVGRHLAQLGREPDHLWENVADVELFSRPSGTRLKRVIFAGNLTPTKVDSALILAIADTGCDVVLAGPQSIDGIDSDSVFGKLFEHTRITYLGNLSLEKLAVETARSMVGIIPYKINPYTEGVFPMKVYEYLSAGLEVISTPLPSLSESDIQGLTISGDEDFTGCVLGAIGRFSEGDAEGRVNAARSNSWTNRVAAARDLIEQISDQG